MYYNNIKEGGGTMNIFEQFESIDKLVAEIQEHNNSKNEQLLSAGESSGAIGGMGFGTLHHNGAITTGFIDGQFGTVYNNGPMTAGSIGGETVSAYSDGINTTIY